MMEEMEHDGIVSTNTSNCVGSREPVIEEILIGEVLSALRRRWKKILKSNLGSDFIHKGDVKKRKLEWEAMNLQNNKMEESHVGKRMMVLPISIEDETVRCDNGVVMDNGVLQITKISVATNG